MEEKIKELMKRKTDLLVKNQPKFERGIAEASLERESEVWQDLREVFIKHKIMPSVGIALSSDKVDSPDPTRPAVACGGIKVNVTYRIMPMDKEGKDGSFSEEVSNELIEIEKELKELIGE